VVRRTARFRGIEEAGAHLTVNDPVMNRRELLQFTQLAAAGGS
jgi:hypothetical protein